MKMLSAVSTRAKSGSRKPYVKKRSEFAEGDVLVAINNLATSEVHSMKIFEGTKMTVLSVDNDGYILVKVDHLKKSHYIGPVRQQHLSLVKKVELVAKAETEEEQPKEEIVETSAFVPGDVLVAEANWLKFEIGAKMKVLEVHNDGCIKVFILKHEECYIPLEGQKGLRKTKEQFGRQFRYLPKEHNYRLAIYKSDLPVNPVGWMDVGAVVSYWKKGTILFRHEKGWSRWGRTIFQLVDAEQKAKPVAKKAAKQTKPVARQPAVRIVKQKLKPVAAETIQPKKQPTQPAVAIVEQKTQAAETVEPKKQPAAETIEPKKQPVVVTIEPKKQPVVVTIEPKRQPAASEQKVSMLASVDASDDISMSGEASEDEAETSQMSDTTPVESTIKPLASLGNTDNKFGRNSSPVVKKLNSKDSAKYPEDSVWSPAKVPYIPFSVFKEPEARRGRVGRDHRSSNTSGSTDVRASRFADDYSRSNTSRSTDVRPNRFGDYIKPVFVTCPSPMEISEEIKKPNVSFHGIDPNDNCDHPIHIVQKNWEQWINSPEYDPSKECVVLVQTGSLNPVHKGHVRASVAAKQELESNKNNKKVLACYLSPSHSQWCSRKKFGCYSNEERFKLTKMHVNGTDHKSWMGADPWETKQPYGNDFPVVCRHVQTELDEKVDGVKIQVIYICGADHASKCGLWRGGRSFGVAVMSRPGYEIPYGAGDKNGVYVVQSGEFDASSTEIREAAIEGQLRKVEKKLHPAVYRALTGGDFLLPDQKIQQQRNQFPQRKPKTNNRRSQRKKKKTVLYNPFW